MKSAAALISADSPVAKEAVVATAPEPVAESRAWAEELAGSPGTDRVRGPYDIPVITIPTKIEGLRTSTQRLLLGFVNHRRIHDDTGSGIVDQVGIGPTE